MKRLHLFLLAILLPGCITQPPPSVPTDWLSKPAVIVVMDKKDNLLDVHDLDDTALAKDREIAFYETQGKRYLAFGRKVHELVRGRIASGTMMPVAFDVQGGQIVSVSGNTLVLSDCVDAALLQKLDRYTATPAARKSKLYLGCPCPKDVGPVLSARDAKALLQRIDPTIQFREDSVDSFGVQTPIYAADKSGPESRVTLNVNIGRRLDEMQPFTHVYINVTTESPKDPKSVAELDAWVRTYIGGFLEGGFSDGKKLSAEVLGTIERMRTDPIVGKSVHIHGDFCSIYYKVWVPVAEIDDLDLTHSLEIIENTDQREMNERYQKSQQTNAVDGTTGDAATLQASQP